MTFDILGEITIDVSLTVEAETEDEAREKAVEQMIREYLILEPTGVDATVVDISGEGG